jgi:hypothetical protein
MSDRNATVESRILAAATALAIETALKIGDQPAKLVVRKKSQAYLYGRLAREFPTAGEAKIREVIAALRWVEWPEDQAPPAPPPPERRPIRGREAVTDPCWAARIAALAALLDAPIGGAALVQLAGRELRWGTNFAIQALAAAEEAGVLEYASGQWSRSETLQTEPPQTERQPAPAAAKPPRRRRGRPLPGTDQLWLSRAFAPGSDQGPVLRRKRARGAARRHEPRPGFGPEQLAFQWARAVRGADRGPADRVTDRPSAAG